MDESKIAELIGKVETLMSSVEEPYNSLINQGEPTEQTLQQFKVDVIQKELEARKSHAELQVLEDQIRAEKARSELLEIQEKNKATQARIAYEEYLSNNPSELAGLESVQETQ